MRIFTLHYLKAIFRHVGNHIRPPEEEIAQQTLSRTINVDSSIRAALSTHNRENIRKKNTSKHEQTRPDAKQKQTKILKKHGRKSARNTGENGG